MDFSKPPHPGWLPILKMGFGYLAMLTLVVLAATIAIGNVQENTSHGLMPIITTLSTLAGGFSQWAFSAARSRAKTEKPLSEDNG
jgi:hypothetical protein